jgi:murein DD-endopeptidase MepM/ murein hydrolase activator NlpD
MNKLCWAAVAAMCCIASPAWADTAEEARTEEEKLLGSANQLAQQESLLPFTRRLHVAGTVNGSLQDSAKAAGVPAVAALEMVRAFAATIDLDEDLINGDSFSLSYRQEYTVEGHPIGVPRIIWSELRTAARGTLSVHRFRPGHSKQESLWLATGESAGPTTLRWPVDEPVISSSFGLRANPIVKPSPIIKNAPVTKKVPVAKKIPLAKKAGRQAGTGGPVSRRAVGRHVLMMHSGVDFAAESGTPIHAAAAGIVTGARPNAGYGNWIEIRHEGELQTVYGHLLAFAPGISEGVWVERGQLIGFVGSTGRSTGPHLHFELLQKGVPANPIVNPSIGRPQMYGSDLERFRRLVVRDRAEQEQMTSF